VAAMQPKMGGPTPESVVFRLSLRLAASTPADILIASLSAAGALVPKPLVVGATLAAAIWLS
jgi:hypothetical protein